jgi:hypothetical protein
MAYIVRISFYNISCVIELYKVNCGILAIMPLMSATLSNRIVKKVAITENKTVTSKINKTLIIWVNGSIVK